MLGFIEDDDVQAVALMPEVPEAQSDENGDILMPDGWDTISLE